MSDPVSDQNLITPYGGSLIDLMAGPEEARELASYADSLPAVRLTERATCDLELLACGAFSPLGGFMGKDDYASVLETMRLSDGRVFPVPVTLPAEQARGVEPGRDVALRDGGNNVLAVMAVEDVYGWDLKEACRLVAGTEDPRHPLVAEMHTWGRLNVSGRLKVLRLPRRYGFGSLRLTPRQTRERLGARGGGAVVAFQTRNPLHRAHEEMLRRALEETGGVLLLHPVVGMTKPGDFDQYVRVRAYKATAEGHAHADRILLALLPLAMRMVGPREALWHAIIRRNYGANHFIVGRDHAGPGKDSLGRPFYEPDGAVKLLARYADEIGVRPISFDEFVYLPDEGRYAQATEVPEGARAVRMSATRLREDYLAVGLELPDWLVSPKVAEVLTESHTPRHRQGVCVWFTGLSGAGKTTTAELLTDLLLEHGREVSLLDGDIVRTHLSAGLGFSKEDRDTNIRRIGFVAAEIVRHGGVAVCAAISPYRAVREEVRQAIGSEHFVEVFVNTPVAVCAERDPKGIYRRAMAGEVSNVTGVDDPYEEPLRAEVTLDTVSHTAEENAAAVLEHLAGKGFVRSPAASGRPLSASGVHGG